MKYTGLPTIYTSGTMKLDLACAKCGTEVAPEFKHCPECGKKLERLPPVVSTENLADEITKLVRKDVLTEASE